MGPRCLILPGTGRWQPAGLTEGALVPMQSLAASPHDYPSAAVPLLVPGRIG
jgi:hypothetical protein